MQENYIALKSVSNMLGENFFIPAYQRGYRWTSQQVEDLLNDITEFVPKEIPDSDKKTWYCLQPIIVKNINNQWDVIDGQQRLTTIYLILHYLNQGYAENRRKTLFKLEYETREGSAEFLKNHLFEEKIDKSNIDYFFISSAYNTIAKWFGKQDENFDIGQFESKFMFCTKVIWYEITDMDSIEMFTRINLGKIRLTNSELIKALFLNSKNFGDKNKDKIKIRLKQFEIAAEWDKMEYALQNESFWYFLNNNESDFSTRIEYIFELMSDKPEDSDEHYTFRFFNDIFKNRTEKEISDNWLAVKRFYQTLEEWFQDRELYHKIGFLIASGSDLKEIIRNKDKKTKSEYIEYINQRISEKADRNIEELEYKNLQSVRRILLLHNIQTMLNNTQETSRFPFDRFKKEKWDVEHISAIAEEMPKTEQHQKDWLTQASKHIRDLQLTEKINTYTPDHFKEIFSEVLNYFNEQNVHEDVNDISNLVLLDASTNRSYKNAVFPVKRSTIITRDKQGIFIPVCTKNVFMKFYNPEVIQMTFWNDSDRSTYLSDIINTIKIYS
ncbi:DUF262 domain-containing protein [Flavobacterium hercynium]|uniref:GmrSD restriction endonucleases N-terminal domain-containing protein n=1 Tax=Flavobacterium hercynium TaxID=387094 RepID=A0A226HI13_9FLAO|nr:DUF262 domain-containing protein [Flavobacterium hercynium]OXA93805.1 hypothetical protein B0A66_06035 [Flavobacterium hercynium]SMP20345.1 Uncharacterized conserved protein, contains ParB-like and HNH nuclease domains [Flavobacterium hercynium]